MTVYVDFISTVKILGKIAKYTGGTNYAKYIVRALSGYLDKKGELKLLLPSGFYIQEKDTFFSSFDIVKANSLSEVEYVDGDILFLPQVNGSLLLQVPKLKKKNPFLKIYGTLHDRQHNILNFDSYDTIFEKGIKRISFISWLFYAFKKKIFNILYNHCVKDLDKVFTVSNFSMQQLATPSVKFIKYYIQGTYIENQSACNRGNYALFVGGNRGEKNLIRALLAFRKYKLKKHNSLKFVATGIPASLKVKISQKVDLKDDIILKEYVSDEDLILLYSNCRFVVFVSKAEGYGCPIREAMQYGKVVLASRTTSVPEVAGAAMYYVDPLDIDSIASGMEYLDNDGNLDKYEEYVSKRNKLVKEMAWQDLEIFINDFFE